MIPLSELFNIEYGHSFDLNKLEQVSEGINFVSRTAKNNGVSAVVKKRQEKPMPAGTITVSLGGSVLEAFVQPMPYYTGYHIFCLKEKISLTAQQKLFYCVCIRANKYKYSYGRQANRTLKDLLVPMLEDIPSWVNKYDLSVFDGANQPVSKINIDFEVDNWKEFIYDDLFEIVRGRGPRKKDLDGSGKTPVITSSDSNNGLTGSTPVDPVHKGNTIGVNRNGSVAEAFYQPIPFCSTEDVHIFTPKFDGLNQYVALFLTTIIKKEKYRYSYGRKWGIERMKNSTIKFPVNSVGDLDLSFMEDYIKTLEYSCNI